MGSRRWLRVTFVVVVLLVPLQLAARIIATEPYPAITQPGFTGTGPYTAGTFTTADLALRAATSDGTTLAVSPEQLLPQTDGVSRFEILQATFRTEAGAVTTDTVRWLRERMVAAFPSADVVSVTFEWLDRVWSARSGAPPAVESVEKTLVTIDLGDAP